MPSAAHIVMDEVVQPNSEPAIIFPTAGGNIHQFTAVTDCAVLDILAPRYAPQGGKACGLSCSWRVTACLKLLLCPMAHAAGRDCTYYKAVGAEANGNVQLVRSEPLPPVNMQNQPYKGVRIKPARAGG